MLWTRSARVDIPENVVHAMVILRHYNTVREERGEVLLGLRKAGYDFRAAFDWSPDGTYSKRNEVWIARLEHGGGYVGLGPNAELTPWGRELLKEMVDEYRQQEPAKVDGLAKRLGLDLSKN